LNGALADLTLVANAHHVLVSGRSVVLSPCERDLLELLLERRGQVLSRREILRDVFGYDFNPGTNIVEVHIAHLRRKLGSAASLIRTVRGAGYFLEFPEAERAEPSALTR
jgi:DNA-binding response OmpR family regulator